MAYGIRDGGSPLIDLIQSYRSEQITRDKMRMDQLNMEQEREYRRKRDLVADRRYEQQYKDSIAQWATAQNETYAQNAFERDVANKQLAMTTKQHDLTVKEMEEAAAQREEQKAARLAIANNAVREAEGIVFGYADAISQLLKENGGIGRSGKTQSIELEPEEGGSLRVVGLGTDGVKRYISNVSPDSDAPETAMRVRPEDVDKITEHLEKTAAFANSKGLKGAQLETYMRASLYQDPETGFLGVADPKQMAENLVKVSSKGGSPTSRDAEVDAIAEDMGSLGTKMVNTLPRIIGDPINAVGDSEFGKALDRRAAEGVSNLLHGAKVAGSLLKPRVFDSSNGAVKVKETGEPVVKPKATPSQVQEAKKEVTAQLAEASQDPKVAEQRQMLIGKLESELLKASSKVRQIQAFNKLYLAGGIDDTQYQNVTSTGRFDTSAIDLIKLQLQADKDNASIRANNSRADYNEAKTASLGATTGPITLGDALTTKEGRGVLKDVQSEVQDVVSGVYGTGGDSERARFAAGIVSSELTSLGTNALTSGIDLTSPNGRTAVIRAAERKARAMNAGKEYPLVTYLTGLSTSAQDQIGSNVARFVADKNTGKPQLISFGGQTTVFDSQNTTLLLNSYLEDMQARRAKNGIEGEMTPAEVTEFTADFFQGVRIEER